MLPTAMISVQNILYHILELYQIDPEPLFIQAGIDPKLLNRSNKRCKVEQAKRLWEITAREINDPCLGVKAAEVWHPSDLGALGYAALASPTLLDTMERINRYQFVVIGQYLLSIKKHRSSITISLLDGILPFPQVANDAILSVLLSICRTNYRNELNPMSVTFKQPEPACSATFHEYFNAPITFGATVNSMAFSIEDMTRPLPSGNPMLTDYNDAILQNHSQELAQENFAGQISSHILRHISTGTSLQDKVASDLCMSRRSFQRTMQEQGITFRKILNETKRILAERYLIENKMSLAEIAFLLGYTRTNSFSRAFTEWAGITPKAFQRKHSER